MSVFVVPVDASDGTEHQEAEVTNQEVTLGRSFLVFSCEDNRISRNQGTLTHKNDSASDCVTIKSTHLNPLYYKIDGSANITTLLKEEKEVFLKDGDQFGLLPDKCWFKISIKKTDLETNNVEAASLMLRVRPLAELNDSQNFPEILPQVSNLPDQPPSEVSSLQNDLIVLQTPDFSFENRLPPLNLEPEPEEPIPLTATNPQDIGLPPVSVKREAEDEENNDDSNKRQKTGDVPGCSSTTPPTVVKKEEPDSNLRDSCQFGIRCYRNTPDHRQEFAHPGDTDYRRPNFPPAPAGVPNCPFGATCYRRNPDHFREYAHPSSTGPAASCSNTSTNAPNWLPRPMRQTKREQQEDDDDDEEESNEEDGDFSGGEDDEEFVLNGNHESSEEEELVTSESDDNSAILDDGAANED